MNFISSVYFGRMTDACIAMPSQQIGAAQPAVASPAMIVMVSQAKPGYCFSLKSTPLAQFA